MELGPQSRGSSSDQDGQGLRAGEFRAALGPTATPLCPASLPEPSLGAGGQRSALQVPSGGYMTLKGFSSLFFG